ncbi:MAG: ABC transporter substrate-binding protein, partial [Bryobacterales bacterium]|nr:ABC transporter substrate-binding protein [Bryobacterales bacterium]
MNLHFPPSHHRPGCARPWRRLVIPTLTVLLAIGGLMAEVPSRLVSTAPSITEILFALGLGDRVVGVSEYCRYPEAARSKPRIGSYLAPNIEVILSMRPDIVFVEEVNARSLAALPPAGFRKVELRHRTIADIYRSIDVIAAAAGVPASGVALRDRLRNELAGADSATLNGVL